MMDNISSRLKMAFSRVQLSLVPTPSDQFVKPVDRNDDDMDLWTADEHP
jgi:hypothetical protein